jgi:hypothetical protein
MREARADSELAVRVAVESTNVIAADDLNASKELAQENWTEG